MSKHLVSDKLMFELWVFFGKDYFGQQNKKVKKPNKLCVTKAKILLKFFYMVGIRKLEVMGTITW